MSEMAYVNGEVTELSAATIPLMDRGHLLGDGLFETMRAKDGVPFRLEDHVERLEHGLKVLDMDPQLGQSFRDAASALLNASASLPRAYIRINITRGNMQSIVDGDGYLVTGFCKSPPAPIAGGVSLVTSPHRKDAADPLSVIKHMSFLPYVSAKRFAINSGADDGVLLNFDGRVAEASTANIFAIIDGAVHAPGAAEGALPGVTRKAILELAEQHGSTIQETLTPEELGRADEAFLSNTNGGIIPITTFDGNAIGNESPGTVTMQLQLELNQLMGVIA